MLINPSSDRIRPTASLVAFSVRRQAASTVFFVEFVMGSPTTTVGLSYECTRPEEMHDIHTTKTVLAKLFQERAHFLGDEPRMLSGDSRALNILLFQFLAKRIDSSERVDSIAEAVIDHLHNRNLIFENLSNSVQLFPNFVAHSVAMEVPPQAPKKVVVPNMGEVIPISVFLGRGVSESKLIFGRIEDDIDSLIPAHCACQSNHPLLAVDQPAHLGRARRTRISAARFD